MRVHCRKTHGNRQKAKTKKPPLVISGGSDGFDTQTYGLEPYAIACASTLASQRLGRGAAGECTTDPRRRRTEDRGDVRTVDETFLLELKLNRGEVDFIRATLG